MKNVRTLAMLALVSLAAVLTVGTSAASAHGGRGGLGGASASTLVTEAAEQLNVTRARLVDAIEDAAVARIDEAVEDEELESEDADDLKEEARDNLRLAMQLSRTRVVASNLGITTTRLNTEFRDARRAIITARIDEAVEDGDLDADDAAELKEELEEAELPGYKAVSFRGFGLGFGGAFAPRGFGFGK